MKQILIDSGNISGAASGANVVGAAEWQGGHGWLSVPNFNPISGAPVLNVTTSLGALPDIPGPITAPGVYPFFAPRGVMIHVEITVQPGEQVSFSSIHLLGNAQSA